MSEQRYRTLVEYMETTGTSKTRLLEMANARLRGPQKMSPTMFSFILSGSRRCSAEKAWALHQITGVSMEELTRWPRGPHSSDLQNSVADAGHSDGKH
jgi:hypothetical protein